MSGGRVAVTMSARRRDYFVAPIQYVFLPVRAGNTVGLVENAHRLPVAADNLGACRECLV